MTEGPTRASLLRVVWAWTPAIATMAAIWILSSSAAPNVPIHALPFRDRGAHFIAYATLAFLVAHGVIRSAPPRPLGLSARARVWMFAIYTAVLWGLLDEVHQAFVPGRSPDLVDLVADGAGASAGGLVRVLLARSPRPVTVVQGATS